MKYKYIILFCTIMILSISTVSAADNTTEDIQIDDTTGDLMDLQTLIYEDTSNYVNLTGNYVGDSNNKTVVINKNITIDGNGYTIDYLSNKPIFDIQASDILIKNLTIIRHNTALGQKTVFIGNTPIFENTNFIFNNDIPADLSDLQSLIDNEKTDYLTLKTDFMGDSNNKTVVINKNITIDGNGYTVDYLSNLPLFDIQASNVTIKNLIMKRHNTALGQKTVFTGDITESNPMVKNSSFLFDNELPTIFANDIIKVYKNDTQYYATIVDANNEPLANTNVTFYVNGVYYNRTTDSNGRAKLNINLNPGKYIITSKNTVTNEIVQNIIEVISPFAMAEDLVKKYKTPAQFQVQLYGSDGKIVGAGEIVTFYINGVYYNRTTDSNGVSSLNINLMPGQYIIASTFKNYTTYNTVTVLEN